MEINHNELFSILLEFNRYLPRTLKIIAIGGTALTLLGEKASTKDIDFCFLEEKDRNAFIRTAERLGYKKEPNRLTHKNISIDIYSNGYIFAVQLSDDYFEKSTKIKEMEKIDLYALHPLDLIITKAARFNKRDEEDIITILKNYKINQNELVDRYLRTMENSMVRDAKDNLIALFALIESNGPIDKTALERAERWAHG